MIQGIIFDYGGTIDTNSRHWSEVLWEGYEHEGIPVSKEEFRTSYVYAERELARQKYIREEHTFLNLLLIKCNLETGDLVSRGVWDTNEENRIRHSCNVAKYCYRYVQDVLQTSRPVIQRLAERYPLVLVSNFYGNLNTILKDFHLEYFQNVVESAKVLVRKPNPAIFKIGVAYLRHAAGKKNTQMPESDIVVVGDSFSKDIMPASTIGCKTVWIKGQGWGDEKTDDTLPTKIIYNINELEAAIEAIGCGA